jgi:AcrR family transcriptional regulator
LYDTQPTHPSRPIGRHPRHPVAAARALFADRGYAAVGTEEIVNSAGLPRGALYHHFTDKVELFAAAFEQVETETNTRIAEAVATSGTTDRSPPCAQARPRSSTSAPTRK